MTQGNPRPRNLVAASEHDLLCLVRALFERPSRPDAGRARPLGQMSRLLIQPRPMPAALHPTALGLIKDTMAKGLILALLRRGGWQRGASLHGDDVRRGRLWERHDPPAFHLSPFALHLCLWLTGQGLRAREVQPLAHTPVTAADELILYLALDLAHGVGASDALAAQPAARGSALCWLGFPDVLARHVPSPADHPPADVSPYAFATWLSGHGALILEALQPDLAARWIDLERDKRRLPAAASLIALGRIQAAVIDAYLTALDSAERRDLAAFLINAAAALLDERPEPRDWQPAVHGDTLHQRAAARRAAIALLRALRALRPWAEEAAATRFFDDEYDAAQLFLRTYEPLAERHARAAAILSAGESIRGLVT